MKETSSGNPAKPRRAAPRFDLIPSGPIRRIAKRFEEGLKYGKDSWKNGLDLRDALNHAIDHLENYRDRLDRHEAGEKPDPRAEDDDLAAAAWGCIALMYHQDKETAGTLDTRTLAQKRASRCKNCGHAETLHETTEYRGDKPRHCMDDSHGGCLCRNFQKLEAEEK